MNTSKSTRCLFCKLLPTPKPGASRSQRPFHTTPNPQARQKSSKRERIAMAAARSFRPYTAREKQLLALKYTPEQLKAIEVGEAAIDTKDIMAQGRWRTDTMSLDYLDDFSKIQPVIDKPVRAPDADIDPDIRVRPDHEIEGRFAKFIENIANKDSQFEARQDAYQSEEEEVKDLQEKARQAGVYPGDGLSTAERADRLRKFAEYGEGIDETAAWERFVANAENFMHSPKGTLNNQSDSLAPAIPKMQSGLKYQDDNEDPHMERLLKQTGLAKEDIYRIRIKNLVCHRVVNQTRMGKIQSMYFLTIAGNQNGMLGIGEGKAAEAEDGRRQAMMAAIRNMKPVPRYEDRTIYGEVEGKVGASVVKLSARGPGFGNRCQHLIFEMARAAGLSDLSARTVRSRNPMNVVKATFAALQSQRLPEDVARARGRKMVDVRKVYYQGEVY